MSPSLITAIRRHSLGWLVAANAVGVLLALLLLWPELNDRLAPFTYGRWVPLHLDWQLYGWCALPLVGALLGYYLPDDDRGTTAGRLALWIWSAALLTGGVRWVTGHTSGKLFLDWTGSGRGLWAFALLVLWLVLMTQGWRQRRKLPRWNWFLLGGLGLVPPVMYWSAGPTVYPAVNPDSGGATGASLLGSTLGIVAIFGWLPTLLKLSPVNENAPTARRWYWAGFALSVSLYAGINHGAASHHLLDQLIGLGSLLIWVPLAWWYARGFGWAAESRCWLAAAFGWWLLLVSTGLLIFLPGMSERLKFTNALVAHSHLAMAGLVTSLHVAILFNLGRTPGLHRGLFWLWQAGCAVQVGVLSWLGWLEGADLTMLETRGGVVDIGYGLRLLAGIAMLLASVGWHVRLGCQPVCSTTTKRDTNFTN